MKRRSNSYPIEQMHADMNLPKEIPMLHIMLTSKRPYDYDINPYRPREIDLDHWDQEH